MIWSTNQGHSELRSCRALEAMRWRWIVGSNTHLTETSLGERLTLVGIQLIQKFFHIVPSIIKNIMAFFSLDVLKISTPHYQGSSLFPFVSCS